MRHTTTVTIWRPTEGGTRDAYGRLTANMAEVGTVPANLFERASSEMVDGVWVQRQQWQLLVPAGTVLTERDVIVDEAGVRFRVETVRSRRRFNGSAHHVSATLVRVTPDAS